MPRRLILTLSTAAWLCGLYSLYALWITPQVEPRDVPRPVSLDRGPSREASNRPLENIRLAELYLAQEPWTRNAKFQLRLAETYIYAMEWEHQGNAAEIRFRPFAMIWVRPGADPEDPPLTIVGDAAVIRFSAAFDKANPQPGRVIGASLEGNVRIRGPEGLSVQGRNFIFSEGSFRLWSDNPVTFTYGGHRGSGHGLQIDLVPHPGEPPKDMPAVDGIRSVTLRRKVAVELAAGKLRKGEDKTPGTLKPDDVVQVSSDGSFRYTVETNLMTFEDNVQVVRPIGANGYDALSCALLTLVFEPPPEGAGTGLQALPPIKADRGAQAKIDGWFPRNLSFQRLLAEGSDRKPAILVSPEHGFRAQMAELTYDAARRVVALRDPREVKIMHGGKELHSPEVTVVHDEAGEVITAVCRGAGWLLSREGSQGMFAAQWLEELRQERDPETGFDVVQLAGQVAVKAEGDLALEAEFIKLWLSRAEKSPPIPSDAAAPRSKKSKESASPLLQRLLALRRVVVSSPQLAGKTKRLEVWFETAAAPLKTAAPLSRKPKPKVRQVASRGNRMEDLLQGGSGDVARTADPESPLSEKPTEPLDVTSELIQARVLRDPIVSDRHDVAEIWSEGGVIVQQEHLDGEAPLKLEGDRLHIQNRGEGDQEMHLLGKSAHVRERGMHLEGGNIHLSRRDNRVWIEGPGLLQMPVKNSLDGQPLETTQLLDVWWKEGMEFNGETASFFEGVRTVFGDLKMRCDSMVVNLSERISFAEEQSPQDPTVAKVKSIECRDGVDFEQLDYEKTKLMGLRRGNVARLTVNNITGEATALGPGTILDWHRGRGNRAGLGAAAVVKSNRPLESDKSEWEYTRIEFSGEMEGNIKERYTTFHDRVLIVYGPVARSTDEIDPDKLPDNGGWMRSDTLQLTHHEATEAGPAFIQMLATGNTELEGSSFHARADSISYDESKGLYMLRSLGNAKATIARQSKPGAPYSRGEAQRIEFTPARNELILNRTTNIDGLP